MNNLPAYILKNCSLFIDKESKIGQTEEITLPVLEVKTEEMRNGGMIKPREIHMGYNATEASFSMTSFDPQTMGLFGLAPGRETPLIAYGYLQSEDGRTHEARAEMRGFFKKSDPGGWQPGEAAKLGSDFAVHSYRLFVDDELIAAIDDFQAIIGGVDQMPGMRDALRMN